MMAINSLSLLYELLESANGFVTTEPPANIADNLPALILEGSAPTKVTNYENPGRGATVTYTLTALAETDEEAWGLIDSAYTLLWESRNKPTHYGWVPYLDEIAAPHLVASTQTAQKIFQYTAVVRAVIRK